jgi:hypothetical protein
VEARLEGKVVRAITLDGFPWPIRESYDALHPNVIALGLHSWQVCVDFLRIQLVFDRIITETCVKEKCYRLYTAYMCVCVGEVNAVSVSTVRPIRRPSWLTMGAGGESL